MNKKAFEMCQAARAALIMDQPFFGALALRLPLLEDESCDTMYTNGKVIGYSPKFVEECTPFELQGVICHEVLHVANGHTWRRGSREPSRWNSACDYAINPIVLENPLLRLPAGGLLNDGYKGMSAEQVYALLPESGQDGGGGNGNGHGQSPAGEVRDYPDPDTAEEAQAEWKVAVSQAAKTAKAMGNLPSSLDRLVEDVLHTKTDWKSVLRRFVQQSAKNDFTWKKPNPRYMHMGFYLPSLHSEEMGDLVVVVDTSGSIDNDIVAQFSGEINGIASEVNPASIHVVYADAAVQRVDVFERGEPITINPKGGGGTNFEPAFDWVEENDVAPVCLIYLTDMMGKFPDVEPEYPVLWAATTDIEGPFGETVRIEL